MSQALHPFVECAVSWAPVEVEGHWIDYWEMLAFARATSPADALLFDGDQFLAWKRANDWAPFAIDITAIAKVKGTEQA